MSIRIGYTTVPVDDQERALKFYTDTLGFVPKYDVPLGEFRWLTVVAAGDPDGVELLLEPDQHPASRAYKEALVADGIPIASFVVDDVSADYDRLVAAGVRFVSPPTDMGAVIAAVLDDTCGNLIQLTTAPAQ